MCQVSLSAFHPIPFSSRPLLALRPRCISFPKKCLTSFPSRPSDAVPTPKRSLATLSHDHSLFRIQFQYHFYGKASLIHTGFRSPSCKSSQKPELLHMYHYDNFMFIHVTSNVCSFSPLECKLHEDSDCFCCSLLYSFHPAQFPAH